MVPSGRESSARPPRARERSQRLIGVTVRAGPLASKASPAMTRRVPALPGRSTAGMASRESSW